MHSVLVVDDDADIRDLIALRLRKAGYDVQSFGNPIEALSAAETPGFDLAILDWSMPEMDGGELCTRLRELPHLADAPIVIVTAHADADTRRRAFSSGASDYMAKPFTLKQLVAAVKETMG